MFSNKTSDSEIEIGLGEHKSNEAVGIRRLRAAELLLRLQKDEQLLQPRFGAAVAADRRRGLPRQPEHDEPSVARALRAADHFLAHAQSAASPHRVPRLLLRSARGGSAPEGLSLQREAGGSPPQSPPGEVGQEQLPPLRQVARRRFPLFRLRRGRIYEGEYAFLRGSGLEQL